MIARDTFQLSAHWELLVLYVSAACIVSGVVLNFAFHAARDSARVAEESIIVASLSMTAFFAILFIAGHAGYGAVALPPAANLAARLSGSLLLVFATLVNLAGRIALGQFWSNQIEIIEGHRVVTSWPYSWSRHPLYGSLVIYGIGTGFVLLNPAIVAATLLVFLPAMRYRARREENLLISVCGEEYRQFRHDVPMLLPRLPEPAARIARGLLGVLLVWATLGLHIDVFALAALLTLGLSFVMRRPDFRLAYRIKPFVILACAATAFYWPEFGAILWLPTAAALMSVSGHCPGTLLIRRLGRPRQLTT